MKHLTRIFGVAITGIAITAVTPTVGFAQAKAGTVPDAQIESDVLKALARNSNLADQAITSTTVYGVVTLSGSVRDEQSRKLAETIVSQTPSVAKVIDELTLGGAADADSQTPENPPSGADTNGSNPLLQSDGTIASPPPQATPANDPQAGQQSPGSGLPQQRPEQSQPPQHTQQPPYDRGPYGQRGSYPPSAYPPGARSRQQGDPGPQAGQGSDPSYGPPYSPPYRQPPSGYQPRPTPYGAQLEGQPVTVPIHSMLRVRTIQELDSKHTAPGTIFDAVVLNDVVSGGFVAIPRGAAVKGVVIDSQQAGAIKGHDELALQLTELVLGGQTYPILSDIWSNRGADKTTRTVDSAVGLGAAGAVIGGVAGGGAGAAIGAGVGGAAGVGASAALGSGPAYVPAEGILTFYLVQQAALSTVSQAEMDRLGYGVAVARRRYVQPGPYGRYPYSYPY